MRLAIFLDQMYWQTPGSLATNESYATFFKHFAPTCAHILFVGREGVAGESAPFALDAPNIRFRALPFYRNLYRLCFSNPLIYWRVRELARELSADYDALLVHGPHPLGQVFAREWASTGRPVILVVRQDLVSMMRSHSGLKRSAATLAAWMLEADFQRLARGRLVLSVGRQLALKYSRHSDRVHSFMPCLISNDQLSSLSDVSVLTGEVHLICVGRLSPEKGHRFLIEALRLLKDRGVLCHLDLVGSGPTQTALMRQTTCLGLAKQVTFRGFVGFGPELFELYGQATIAVLPSLTEGFPQVINEALSLGIPTVSTCVGGIPDLLNDGEHALLVPPANADLLARAIERLIRDANLRDHLRRNGRLLMSQHTLEANRDRILGVIRHEITALSGTTPFRA